MMSVSVPSSAVESKLVPQSAALPLTGAALRVSARGGIARVVLEQTFENRHPDPLSVTYVLPLPADAAVSGFSFRIGERVIVGEVDRKRAARERYEDAIARGQTAALLEQDRSSLFTQEIGNVPPGERVVCEIVLDQRLRWLDEGSWEWRFPLAAAPRYLGAAGRVVDAQKLALEVAHAIAPRASLELSIGDGLVAGRTPESPSHPLQCATGLGVHRVELGSGNRVELDRDVVVRWPVAAQAPSLSAVTEDAKGALHALFTIVPPQTTLGAPTVARDLVVLLDTSGSMHGAPLDQARRVTMALIDGLGDRDSIELIEFSNQPRRMWKTPIWATKENKAHAMGWLAQLRASGGTEMREGILEALRPLRADAQRQIVLVTDGLIGFEQEIVETILQRLPAGSRVHTVGVGSSVNRSLTAPAARAGKGLEVVIGLGEDPERAANRLRARTELPLVVDVTLEGAALLETAPAKIPDLYAGAPVLAAAKLRPEGGEIVVRGRTAQGAWEQRVRIAPRDATAATGVAALFAREAVEDAETRLAAGSERHAVDRIVEELGLAYQIATRLTSWVAIDQKVSVDPLAPSRKEVMPQMLPHGMSVDGLGLRGAAMPMHAMPMGAAPMAAMPMSYASAPRSAPTGAPPPAQGYGGGAPPAPPPPPAAPARMKLEAPEPAADGFADEHEDIDYELDAATIAPAEEKARAPERDLAAKAAAPKKKVAPRPLVRGAFTGASAPVFPVKLVKRAGRELTFELVAVMALAWDPSQFVELVLASGARITAKVDFAKTTRAAQLDGRQVARLVLVLDADTAEAIREIVFTDQAFAVG